MAKPEQATMVQTLRIKKMSEVTHGKPNFCDKFKVGFVDAKGLACLQGPSKSMGNKKAKRAN
jgi:hypothetical protein